MQTVGLCHKNINKNIFQDHFYFAKVHILHHGDIFQNKDINRKEQKL